MKIKLLQPEYKTQEFYQYFLENKLWDSNYISEDYVWIPCEIPSFPIFLSTRDTEKKEKEFILAINIISENVIVMDRDIFMSERFWHSWLCLYQREYLIETYPQIKEGYEKFKIACRICLYRPATFLPCHHQAGWGSSRRRPAGRFGFMRCTRLLWPPASCWR